MFLLCQYTYIYPLLHHTQQEATKSNPNIAIYLLYKDVYLFADPLIEVYASDLSN